MIKDILSLLWVLLWPISSVCWDLFNKESFCQQKRNKKDSLSVFKIIVFLSIFVPVILIIFLPFPWEDMFPEVTKIHILCYIELVMLELVCCFCPVLLNPKSSTSIFQIKFISRYIRILFFCPYLISCIYLISDFSSWTILLIMIVYPFGYYHEIKELLLELNLKFENEGLK